MICRRIDAHLFLKSQIKAFPFDAGRPLFHQTDEFMTGNPSKTRIAFQYLKAGGTDTGQEDLHQRGVFIGKGGRKGGVSF